MSPGFIRTLFIFIGTRKSITLPLGDVSSNTSELNLTAPNSDTDAVDWSPDGTHFAFGNNNKDLFLNDGSSTSTFNTRLEDFTEPSDDVESLEFSYNSQWLVAGMKNNRALFYRRKCSIDPIGIPQHCPA